MNKKMNHLYIVIIISMLLYGGTWVSGDIVSVQAEKEILIFWRFFVTFISFIPVIIYRKESLKLTKMSFLQVLLGTFFLVGYNLFFFGGLRLGLAGAGGVIVTTLSPIMTFMISAVIFKQKIKTKDWLSLVIGFSGGMIILQIWNVLMNKQLQSGDLYFIFAALSWSLLSITSQKSKAYLSSFTFSFYTYGLSALVNFCVSIPKGLFSTDYFTTNFIVNILYLSIGATTFATTAYFIATTKLGASKSSTFTFLVPTSALLFSYLLLDEIPTIYSIIGGILALVAVYLINYKSKKTLIMKQTKSA